MLFHRADRGRMERIEHELVAIRALLGELFARPSYDPVELFKVGVDAASVKMGLLPQEDLTPEDAEQVGIAQQANARAAVEQAVRDMENEEVARWKRRGTERDV